MPPIPIRWSWILIGLLILLGLWIIAAYNGLIVAQENVSTQWAQVETQYQRRVDLVPNLVNTVKGAARFEQDTLQNVTEARTKWMQTTAAASPRSQQIAAAQEFESALSRLLVTVEAYPQLLATQAFRDLMTQLEGTENRVAVARRDYNEAVRAFNLRVKRFPGKILAGFFGFSEESFFEAQPGAEQAPPVKFE